MKNILQVMISTTDIEDDDTVKMELQNGKKLFICRAMALKGDVASDLFRDLTEDAIDGFRKDLEIYFREDERIKVNWGHYASPQEMEILYEETWEHTSSIEYGDDWDYWAEYLGILNMETLTEENCYNNRSTQ